MIPWINAVYKTKLEKILSEKSGMPVKLVLQSQENSEVPAADPVPETSAAPETSVNFGIPPVSSLPDKEKKENPDISFSPYKTEENPETYEEPVIPDFMNSTIILSIILSMATVMKLLSNQPMPSLFPVKNIRILPVIIILKKSRKPVTIIHYSFTALQVWAKLIFFLLFPIM